MQKFQSGGGGPYRNNTRSQSDWKLANDHSSELCILDLAHAQGISFMHIYTLYLVMITLHAGHTLYMLINLQPKGSPPNIVEKRLSPKGNPPTFMRNHDKITCSVVSHRKRLVIRSTYNICSQHQQLLLCPSKIDTIYTL